MKRMRMTTDDVPLLGMNYPRTIVSCPKMYIPWERAKASHILSPDVEHYCFHLAETHPKFKHHRKNRYLDDEAKRALVEVSNSVVALVSYIDKEFRCGSGTIIENNDMMSIVLTSANIIRPFQDVSKNDLPDNLKITVYSSSGESYVGDILAYDYHYNLAVISFQSETPVSIAKIALIDDSLGVSLNPSSHVLQPHSKSCNLTPGDGVIAVGRYFYKKYDLMGACGAYCIARSILDCKELFQTTCSITGCGDGGPMINYNGEVIGVTFHYSGLTPFLPINIAIKWWKHYKLYGRYCRPSLGIEATNFFAADLEFIERVIMKFPDVCKGVIVERVIPGSSARLAGLHENDVIFLCDGKPVQSFLEFLEIIWNKVGELVELVVAREDSVEHVHLSMHVVEAVQDQLNSWPTQKVNRCNNFTGLTYVGPTDHSRNSKLKFMGRKEKGKMFWERYPASRNYSPDDEYYFETLATKKPKFRERTINAVQDIQEKRVALEVLPSVVALISYSGDEQVMEGSGTIIESNNVTTIVLTAASFIRRCSVGKQFMENDLINDLKVTVYNRDGQSYKGEVVAVDYHYNLAAISFHSEGPLPTAKIGEVDDSLDVLLDTPSFELRQHSSSYKLSPGAEVYAVTRYFYKPFAPMVASGAYWVDRCGYDCKELFKTSCQITKSGEGGPLINHLGEVIGIIYYDLGSTPCMPISIAYKWWEQFKTRGKYRRPLLGMEAGNFYTADANVIERVNHIFPSVYNGVIVEEVKHGSSASLAGLCVDDVIIECAGRRVNSFLVFFEIIWENVGDHVTLVVLRQKNVEQIHLSMFVEEATLDQFSRWPYVPNPKYC